MTAIEPIQYAHRGAMVSLKVQTGNVPVIEVIASMAARDERLFVTRSWLNPKESGQLHAAQIDACVDALIIAINRGA